MIKTQRNRILWLLKKNENDWVSLPSIARCAMQYNTRIFELRQKLGYKRIVNKIEVIKGRRHSWYMLKPKGAV